MKQKPGLLFIINELATGGAETYLVRLAEKMQADFRISVLTYMSQNNDDSFIEMMRSRVEFSLIEYPLKDPTGFRNWLFWKINALFSKFGKKGVYVKLRDRHKRIQLGKILQENNVKVGMTSSGSSDYFSSHYLKKHYNLPIVLTMHSSYNKENWHSLGSEQKFFIWSQSIFEKVDYIFYTAEYNYNIFNQIDCANIPKREKLHMGYEPKIAHSIRNDYSIQDGAFVCTMFARGIPEKGWNEALTAFSKFLKTYPNSYFFALAPNTEYMQSLQQMYSQNSHIIFTGYVAEPEHFIYSSDCTMLPSYYPESLPNSVIESLAYGKPVLVTDVADTTKMIQYKDKQAGFIIPFTTEKKADDNFIFEKLVFFAENPEVLHEKQELAKYAFQKFSLEKSVKRYKEIFNELIHERI